MNLTRRHIDVVLITCGIIFAIFTISCVGSPPPPPPECFTDEFCDDGLFCNGVETCGVICIPGTSVDCSDGIGCTDDSCDEDNDVCVNDPNDALCDDGVGCTVDTCDPVSDCVFTPEDAGCYPDCENMGDVDVYIKDESHGCFGDDPEMECCLEVCDVVLGDENVSDAILQPIDGSDPPAVACICCPKV
jgi:hypothetical protein